jgi:hypothetical protein
MFGADLDLAQQVEENHQQEQYFFTPNTTRQLADLTNCATNLCCLCTPSVFYTSDVPNKVLLDIDLRVINGNTAYPFDLNQIIYDQYLNGKHYNYFHLENKYDCIIIDPPFDGVNLAEVAKTVSYLADYTSSNTSVFLIHQKTRAPLIARVFEQRASMITTVRDDILLEYANPCIRDLHSKRPVCLYEMRPGI